MYDICDSICFLNGCNPHIFPRSCSETDIVGHLAIGEITISSISVLKDKKEYILKTKVIFSFKYNENIEIYLLTQYTRSNAF